MHQTPVFYHCCFVLYSLASWRVSHKKLIILVFVVQGCRSAPKICTYCQEQILKFSLFEIKWFSYEQKWWWKVELQKKLLLNTSVLLSYWAGCIINASTFLHPRNFPLTQCMQSHLIRMKRSEISHRVIRKPVSQC